MPTPETWRGEAERLRRAYLDPVEQPTICCGEYRNCQRCQRWCPCLNGADDD